MDAAADKISADGPQGLDRRESWSVSYRLAVPTPDVAAAEDHQRRHLYRGRGRAARLHDGQRRRQASRVAGDVRGRTSNGGVDVDLDGATWQGEGLDVETSNGGVRIRIPEQYSARLEAGTVNGGISVDFPIGVQGRIDREIIANLGAGGPAIRVHTHNGGVKVTRK